MPDDIKQPSDPALASVSGYEPPSTWKSCAEWPPEAYSFNGGVSEDTHGTKEFAEAICRQLERDGFGGGGIHYPLRTWVEEIKAHNDGTEPLRAGRKE